MKKSVTIIMLTLLCHLALSGCNKGDEGSGEDYRSDLTYSNLLDEASREELREAMEAAGLAEGNIESFFQGVENFNSVIEGKDLVEEGFVTIDSLEPDYDLFAIQDRWEKKNPDFIGYNCRIVSYDLMKDGVKVGNLDGKNSDWLVFDEIALDSSPRNLLTEEEAEEFKSFYSFIPTEDTKDIKVHLEKVKEDWQRKEISFPNKDKRSLISVFFHDEQGYLFIGHIGVLIPSKDGKLLFIEKLTFQAPYQVIKFDNRVDLNDYLMNKYDIAWGQPTAKPFIMENDQLLEGYRENPNNKGDVRD